ncbi:MAG: hypothetical protein RBG13Loki_4102 [Promethearchaeota archaeon CR_4]|nr:MAG: hypothetical protein RBG13Loki_4102 [Candidatus Lokiarchaeota archaeon CR_4]
MTDEQGKIILWNGSSERIFGVKRIDVLGNNLWDVQFEYVAQRNKNPQYNTSLKNEILDILHTG